MRRYFEICNIKKVLLNKNEDLSILISDRYNKKEWIYIPLKEGDKPLVRLLKYTNEVPFNGWSLKYKADFPSVLREKFTEEAKKIIIDNKKRILKKIEEEIEGNIEMIQLVREFNRLDKIEIFKEKIKNLKKLKNLAESIEPEQAL